MSTKLWSSCLCWNCIWGYCMSPAPSKFELPIVQEGMVYKIWDSVYKIVQNEYKIMIQFFMLKLHLWAACHQPPKFEFPIAQEGMVYKIWDSMYKIVQNEYKIMTQFFMLKLHLGGCMSPASKIWIADSARKKGVQNLGFGVKNFGLGVPDLVLGVQSCTKWVQNYDPFFYVETAFGGLHVTSPLKFELPIAQDGMVYKIWTRCTKLYKISTKLWYTFRSRNPFWGCRWHAPIYKYSVYISNPYYISTPESWTVPINLRLT